MIDLNYIEIGNKMKEKRKSLSLTQNELAEMIGLTESSISRYEAGKISTMPTSTINKICDVLNIKPAELLGLTAENSFEYDLKDILSELDLLPYELRKAIIDMFKSQIILYRRIYNEKGSNLFEEKQE